MSAPTLKAVVLDIGGVLIRTEDRTGREKLEERYELDRGKVDDLVFHSKAAQDSTIGKVEQDAVWQVVASELSITKQELDEFKRLFWSGDQLDHQLLLFLQDIQSAYTTVLLSNAWQDHRRIFEDEFGIIEGQTVDYVLISSELGMAKPDPQIYRFLADTVNCEYDEILFVDDFIENILSAQALGIQTIHYQPGMNLVNEIKSRLDKNK